MKISNTDPLSQDRDRCRKPAELVEENGTACGEGEGETL